MEKIGKLTYKQFEKLILSDDKKSILRELLNSNIKDYEVGDTVVQVSGASAMEVYENKINRKIIYYVVVKPIDKNLAIAYSLYPLGGRQVEVQNMQQKI